MTGCNEALRPICPGLEAILGCRDYSVLPASISTNLLAQSTKVTTVSLGHSCAGPRSARSEAEASPAPHLAGEVQWTY
jgi:hypothetical protein